MTTDGWEQRLADLGQARELREAIASTLCTIEQQQNDMGGQFVHWEHAGSWRRERHLDQADALLDGPLAPLLAALSTKQHNHTRFTNDSGATWSSCPKSCPVAIRRSLDSPT